MTQLTRADLAGMTPAEIETARTEGRFNVLLGGRAPIDPGAHITRADITQLYSERRYDEIEGLRRAGRLDHILDGSDDAA